MIRDRMFVVPGWDNRDNPNPVLRGKGAHSATLVYGIADSRGAVYLEVNTGWMAWPLAGMYQRNLDKNPRRDEPGVDKPVQKLDPIPSLWRCSPVRLENWDAVRDACPFLGGTCYTNQQWSHAAGVMAFRALIEKGNDGLREKLLTLHHEAFGD